EKITCSSESDRLWVKENIIDGRNDYGWSSKEKTTPSEEFLLVDLGSVNRVDEIRILSKMGDEPCFPELFYFYYSEDDLAWNQWHEEPLFIAEGGVWYKWKFFPTNMRFFKLLMVNNKANSDKRYVSKVIELEIFAAPDYLSLSKKQIINETPPYASVIRSGLVRLAADAETNPGVAIQGNDRRLRDATTEFKGIVELATDGEEKDGVVVQGSDRRLKNATEIAFGLARLARNGEDKSGVVVQGNDDRLKNATTDYPGIVELAEDSETRPGVAVQGNDSRLKKATTSAHGLVILSELGADHPGRVVTADDPRFKKATTENVGILRFASNGEDSALAAVQGNDKRLKKANTESAGIVELAQSGETKEGVVVQGSDKRLKYATESDSGIMTFAEHETKVPLKAVQADDPRLFDSRPPKPHNHNYADKEHSYDSHVGFINLIGSTSSELKNITVPMKTHSVIFGKNESKGGSGISGVGIDEGVLGHGEDIGVLGLSNGTDDNSAGIAGFSKKGYGGVFVSNRKHAIYANGDGIKKKEVNGSGKALLAKGDSDFYGVVRAIDNNGIDCIARYFKIQGNDIIQEGDLLVLGEKEGTVARSRASYSSKIIGVCVKSASIELGEKKSGNEFVLVGISGIVKLNVDANEGGAITPGDLIVSGLAGGHGIKADINKLKPGMLLGKAISEQKKDRGSIFLMLTPG
ncbi:MAG: discoidin domain-containing protein, partial [Leptospiraceae bacterium]|nr:discoidin domain-containing protein [Leptospiraceae bacterium]